MNILSQKTVISWSVFVIILFFNCKLTTPRVVTLMMISVAKDHFICNVNHIVKILLHCFKRHQDLLVNYILFYNFPFRFLKAMEFQHVSNFFLAVFGLHHEIQLTAENSGRVSKYCRITDFFKDLASAILSGESSLDESKMDQNYKPPQVSELINLDFHALAKFSIDSLTSNPKSQKLDTLDEKLELLPDIDRIQEVLDRGIFNKTHTHFQQPTHKKAAADESLKPKLSPEKAAKYPSLRERWDKMYPQSENAKSQESVNKSLSSLNDSYSRSNFGMISKHLTDQIVERGTNNTNNQISMRSHQTKGQLNSAKSAVQLRKMIHISKDSKKDLNGHSKIVSDSKTSDLSSILSEGLSKKNYSPYRRKLPNLCKSQLASPYLIDESMDQGLVHHLSEFYPSSTKILVETDVEKEAKKAEFAPAKILQHEEFSIQLSELLYLLISQVLENQSGKFRELLQQQQKFDYEGFWYAVLDSGESKFFELILKVDILSLLCRIGCYCLSRRITCSRSKSTT